MADLKFDHYSQEERFIPQTTRNEEEVFASQTPLRMTGVALGGELQGKTHGLAPGLASCVSVNSWRALQAEMGDPLKIEGGLAEARKNAGMNASATTQDPRKGEVASGERRRKSSAEAPRMP